MTGVFLNLGELFREAAEAKSAVIPSGMEGA
jgi:hypothetical protein